MKIIKTLYILNKKGSSPEGRGRNPQSDTAHKVADLSQARVPSVLPLSVTNGGQFLHP